MSRKKHEITNQLLEQVLREVANRMGSEQGAQDFIFKVLTNEERQTIGRRILIARLLLEGYSGAEIADLMNVSPNTLSRVRRWLEEDIPYATIPSPRITAKQSRRTSTPKPSYGAPFSFERLSNAYPMHFLLFNLIAELRKPRQ